MTNILPNFLLDVAPSELPTLEGTVAGRLPATMWRIDELVVRLRALCTLNGHDYVEYRSELFGGAGRVFYCVTCGDFFWG